MGNAQAPQQRRLGFGRSLCVAIIALLCLVTFSGCKDSDVLTEKLIGDPGQYEVDYSLPPVSINDPNAPISDGSEHEDDAEDENNRDIEESDPLYSSENPTTEAQAAQNAASSHSSNGLATTGASIGGQSEEAGAPERGADSSGDGDGEGYQSTGKENLDDPANDDPEKEKESPDKESQDSEEGDEQTEIAPDVPGEGTVIDDPEKGGYDELPYANKIAAAGPYATMVQALGGKGALAAVNTSWLSDMSTKGAFPGELDDIVAISEWGDGTGMNDATVQKIIESGADTYIYSNAYGMLSQMQAAALSHAGINVVAMPTVGVSDAQDSDIQLAVELIGALLEKSEADSLDAKAMADEWRRQHDQAMSDTLRAGTGQPATLILDGYSYNWYYQAYNGVGGNATGLIGESNSRFYTTYIDGWGTMPAGYSRFRARGNDRVWPSLEWAPHDPTGEAVRESHADGIGLSLCVSGKVSSWYQLYQYYLQYAGLADTQVHFTGGVFGTTSNLVSGINVLWGSPTTGAGLFSLGDNAFPVLFVRDLSIAQRVQASAARADRSTLQVGVYNYGNDYQILVMPEGVAGNWVDGTFESFLMVPWAYAGVQAALAGNSDISSCESYIAAFYNRFYRLQGSIPANYNAVLPAVCGR